MLPPHGSSREAGERLKAAKLAALNPPPALGQGGSLPSGFHLSPPLILRCNKCASEREVER